MVELPAGARLSPQETVKTSRTSGRGAKGPRRVGSGLFIIPALDDESDQKAARQRSLENRRCVLYRATFNRSEAAAAPPCQERDHAAANTDVQPTWQSLPCSPRDRIRRQSRPRLYALRSRYCSTSCRSYRNKRGEHISSGQPSILHLLWKCRVAILPLGCTFHSEFWFPRNGAGAPSKLCLGGRARVRVRLRECAGAPSKLRLGGSQYRKASPNPPVC